jgi:hypothetical protein
MAGLLIACPLFFGQACRSAAPVAEERATIEANMPLKSKSGRFTYTPHDWGFEIEGAGPYGTNAKLAYDIELRNLVTIRIYRAGKHILTLTDYYGDGSIDRVEELDDSRGWGSVTRLSAERFFPDGAFRNTEINAEYANGIFKDLEERYAAKLREIKLEFQEAGAEIPIPEDRFLPGGELERKRAAIERMREERAKPFSDIMRAKLKDFGDRAYNLEAAKKE